MLPFARGMTSALIALATCASAIVTPVNAAEPGQEPKVAAALVAPVTAVIAGTPFTVGLHQAIAPHWHTYWKNPGDSGEPTRLTWTLPEGFKASDIEWPIPEAIPVGPLVNFGYSNETLLPVTITPPKDYSGNAITLTAKAEWLVCEKICIPEEKTVTLTLPVVPKGTAVAASGSAELFAAAARAQPVEAGWKMTVERSAGGRVDLAVAAPGLDRTRIVDVRFFPNEWGAIENAGAQKMAWTGNGFTLEMRAGETVAAARAPLEGVLVVSERLTGDQVVRNGILVMAPGSSGNAAAGGGLPYDGISLWQAVVFAALGGIILNLMPCVLPILSVKVMSLAAHGAAAGPDHIDERRARLFGGLAYLAGVSASFAGLAVLIVSLRGAGEALGWGFQFQSPLFVLFLAALFLAMGLSMSGLYDVGGALVGTGQSLTRRNGWAGSFFTGVLATLAATPCTAPFMGAAIGYAMTRPAAELVLVLQSLGVGFAAPVLALSVSSRAGSLLPRPGPWMEVLKQALAFPLYGTVAWLVWVLSLQSGSDGVLAAAIVLVAVAFACWLIGQRRLGLAPRAIAATGAVVLALALALPQAESTPKATARGVQAPASDGSEPFSMTRIDELRSSGRPVFVNLTAAWCISCKVNERIALQTEGFRKSLREHGVVYMKGDWTSRDDAITKVLASYGRAGVPLYLLFPADPAEKAIILPQLLTEAIVTRHFASLKGAPVRL